MIENNKDALEELMMRQAKAMGKDVDTSNIPTINSSVSYDETNTHTSSNVVEHNPIISYDDAVDDNPSISIDNNTSSAKVTVTDDEYGFNDLENEIAEEEKQYREERQNVVDTAYKNNNSEPPIFMPPDERDMKYHEDAIGFQSEKLAVVSNMVQRVVAKYRLISGGIPETPVSELKVIGRRAVMGELIDIYHKNGEKITPEFENIVLRNWVMPDGTLAINNINSDGIIIDKTMMNTPSVDNTKSEKNVDENTKESDNKSEPVTVNITVEKDTPVTVNVDESIVNELTKVNEVNIHVKEVTEKEMMATTVVENSNKEGIISVYDSGINDVPLTLPLSAYRCVMRPINWFDFIKLTAPTSNNVPDAELRKWSVIYRHIKNPSIGEFKNFEDFLKKTKYYDKELLMWGLLVATTEDVEPLVITCGNKKCQSHIHINYNPRKLVHIDESLIPPWYEDCHKAAPGKDAYAIWESVNGRRRRYRLPNTGIIAEINEPSAYDFINKTLPLTNELYKRYRPDGQMTDININDQQMIEFDYLTTNAMYISALTIVREENGKRKEYRYTNWDDIEKIVTESLDAGDSGILLKLIDKTRSKITPVSFRLDNVNCPSCGRHDEYIPIDDISTTLLFQLSRRLDNTQINLIEMD